MEPRPEFLPGETVLVRLRHYGKGKRPDMETDGTFLGYVEGKPRAFVQVLTRAEGFRKLTVTLDRLRRKE